MKGEDLAQFAGPPRSLIWRGGAVHLRGCSATRKTPDLHAHFALQLTVSLEGDVSLRCARSDPERLAAGWLIRSDQPHWFGGVGMGVTFFWDPVCPLGRLVATRLNNEGAAPLTSGECGHIRGELKGCWERGWRHADLRVAAERTGHIVARPGGAVAPIDRRVQMVLRELQRDPAEKSSFAEFARLTGLSQSGLAHLFRRDVGIPFRQYRLALRMEQAVREIAVGASLTRAAYAAGFADPAHFCRICRRMFGGAPSELPSFQLEDQSTVR
jgi:AraC family transcriptional regulator